jgi:hypothetical protein
MSIVGTPSAAMIQNHPRRTTLLNDVRSMAATRASDSRFSRSARFLHYFVLSGVEFFKSLVGILLQVDDFGQAFQNSCISSRTQSRVATSLSMR